MLVVATFFYAWSIVSILVFAATLVASNGKLGISSLFWGLADGIAAFYLLKGSVFAKRFLVAMSVISVVTAVLVLWLGGGPVDQLLGAFFGVGGACSLYLLTLSSEFRSEFNRRHADYEAEKQAARQKLYDEFETADDKDGS
jgi:hypothetical protein